MKEYLQHEFCRYSPALFEKGMMRKRVKSILAQVLKEEVTPLSLEVDHLTAQLYLMATMIQHTRQNWLSKTDGQLKIWQQL